MWDQSHKLCSKQGPSSPYLQNLAPLKRLARRQGDRHAVTQCLKAFILFCRTLHRDPS